MNKALGFLGAFAISSSSFAMWGGCPTMFGPYYPPSQTSVEGKKLQETLVGKPYSVVVRGQLRVGVIRSVSDPNVAYSPDRTVTVGIEVDGKVEYVERVSVAALLGAGAAPPAFPGTVR